MLTSSQRIPFQIRHVDQVAHLTSADPFLPTDPGIRLHYEKKILQLTLESMATSDASARMSADRPFAFSFRTGMRYNSDVYHSAVSIVCLTRGRSLRESDCVCSRAAQCLIVSRRSTEVSAMRSVEDVSSLVVDEPHVLALRIEV